MLRQYEIRNEQEPNPKGRLQELIQKKLKRDLRGDLNYACFQHGETWRAELCLSPEVLGLGLECDLLSTPFAENTKKKIKEAEEQVARAALNLYNISDEHPELRSPLRRFLTDTASSS